MPKGNRNSWQDDYRRNRERTRCPVDLNTYFESDEIAGRPLAVMDLGELSVPTGRLIVRDPFVYMPDRHEKPYLESVPPGRYPVQVSVVLPEEGECARYAAVRMIVNDRRPVGFYEALVGYEKVFEMGDGEYFGFAVDTGLGCICDEETHQEYCDWIEDYESENEEDAYTGYFSELFEESARARPEHQREAGDWIVWTVPGTDHNMMMFQSGFGDGAYPVYWGYDADGAICQAVIQFIDIELNYGDDDERSAEDGARLLPGEDGGGHGRGAGHPEGPGPRR